LLTQPLLRLFLLLTPVLLLRKIAAVYLLVYVHAQAKLPALFY
jgi:hypothetical protein